MKINDRLKVNAWISLCALFLVLIAIAWSFVEIRRADRNTLLINEMRKVASERIFLRDNYLLIQSEPARIRWYAKSETLRALLKSASERFRGTEDEAILQDARKSFDETSSSFTAILESHKHEEGIGGKSLAYDEAESATLGRVFLHAYALSEDIEKLLVSSRGAETRAQHRGAILVVVFLLGGVMAMAGNSISLRRSVAGRILSLSKGVETIGGGNLEYRFDEAGGDELSKLAGASNKMVAELRASREYSESIINTVREPLIALDQDLRVVTANRSFYEFFIATPDETLGQLVYDLGNKQWDIPKLRDLLETILPQKATFENYEVEHDFVTIGRRIMLLNARQIQRALGKERIILLAIEDITERKEVEDGLKKAHEELEALAAELGRAARAKSEFLANMSHELRTPLNSIIGFSEVLYDETFGPLGEKQKKYVNNVLASGKHLLLLINQILDTAKIESGKMTLALSRLPMNGLLDEIVLLVTDMVGKKKLRLALEIADDLPNIEADELKVKEIIYNLLSNAIKFTPEGGAVGLRAKRSGSEMEIVVWDSGIGIAPENMDKIFEGFFRVDTPYSRLTEGTGLGLPLSRRLAELHGGKLTVESPGLGKGTSVRFTLPIVSGKAA